MGKKGSALRRREVGKDSTAQEIGLITFPEAGTVRWEKRKLEKQKRVFHHQLLILILKPPNSMSLHSFPGHCGESPVSCLHPRCVPTRLSGLSEEGIRLNLKSLDFRTPHSPVFLRPQRWLLVSPPGGILIAHGDKKRLKSGRAERSK